MLRSKYRNLVIIGNGFDRWQNLPTSYEEFRKYYIAHVDLVMEQNGFSKYVITDEEGNERLFSSVELIYGNPFEPSDLPNEFFWTFETSLDKLDDQRINMYFGRSEQGIADLGKMVKEAQFILRTLFCDWIVSLNISKENSGFRFSDDCFFINFNYTDTLEKRFGVNSKDIYHIHGSADNKDSIIVGHSTHPETAFQELKERHFMKSLNGDRLPRIDGLYAVEDALYQTDKHVEDNIDSLCSAMLRRGVHIEDIENIYVLGHSFGEPDLEYFKYLDNVTRCGCDYDSLSAAARMDLSMLALMTYGGEEVAENVLLEQIYLNVQYAAHHRDRTFADAPSFYPELDAIDETNGVTYPKEEAEKAVQQRFLFEQANRTKAVLKELAQENGLPDVPEGCRSVLGLADFLDWGHAPRKKNATWHITCYSPEAEKRVKSVMKDFRQKRYTLYKTIDACMEKWKN